MKWLSGFLAIGILFIYSSLTAQTSEFKEVIAWSQPFQLDKNFRLREVVTLSDGSASMIGANSDGLFHFKFGRDGSYLGAEKLLKSASNLYGYIVQGDSLYVVNAEQIRAGRRISIHLFDMSSSTSSTALASFQTHFNSNKKSIKRLVWGVSPNGNHWMVSQQSQYYRSSGSSLDFKTYDLSSRDTGSFKVSLPYESDDFEYLDGLISDSGSVFLTGRTGIQLNSPFRRKFLVFSYSNETREIREFNMNPENIFLQEIKMHASEDGVVAVGIYSTDPFADNETSGYLLTKFNMVGDSIETKYIQGYSPTEVRKNEVAGSIAGEGSIEDFFLQEMVQANNWYGVFEKRFLDQVCATDPRTGIMDCTDQYNFLGLTVVNLSDPGKSTFINRKQVDFNSPGAYISNVNVPMGDKLLVLYNDHFKNSGKENERIMNNATRSAIRAVVIDSSMKTETFRLTETRQNDYVFVSKVACKGTDKGAYLLSSDGRQYRLGFLAYEGLKK